MGFLEDIVARTRVAVAERERVIPLDSLREQVAGRRRGRFQAALSGPGVALIAEFKRRAPSSSLEHPDASVVDYASAYAAGGARALSILTEETEFGGTLSDLHDARATVDLPLLRKDFVVTEYQVYEAAAAAADAILLIAAVLTDPAELSDLHALAHELGLDVLLEVRNEPELDIAVGLGAQIIGINNRDLPTLQIDVGKTLELAPKINAATIVSESGIHDRATIEAVAEVGVAGVLIGSALMEASNPAEKCRELAGVRSQSMASTGASDLRALA